MFVVDGQVHIWEASTPQRPWTARQPPHRPVPFSKDDLLREMSAAGVDRAVIVPPSWQGVLNEYALEAACSHPDRFAVMGLLDVRAPDAREQIANWRRQAGMLGLRLSFNIASDSSDDWLWSAAEAAGVPIMMVVYPGQLAAVDQIAQRHDGLKLVIDHFGIPQGGFRKGKRDDEAFAHLDQLMPLARRHNIAVKASSLPACTTDSYPYRRLHSHIRRVYDAFGPKRMFWGTDLTKLACTYRQAVTMFTEEIPWFSVSDKEWIMGRGLCEWLGWKLKAKGYRHDSSGQQ